MRTKTITLTAAGCILICGIAIHRAPAPMLAATAPIEDRIITRLVGHDQTITVYSTATGPRYSVATSDGKLLLASATLEELREKDPASYKLLSAGVAWAGVETGNE
jgi:hypothetical protein